MATTIDACGLACPAPVLLVKDAVERQNLQALTVLVDNEASNENVTRFLRSRGYSVAGEQESGLFRLTAQQQASSAQDAAVSEIRSEHHTGQKNLVLITSDRFGSGDDELGRKLMINYLKTLKEMGDNLWQLIFVNSGVKLTIASSPVLSELQGYEQAGVIVLACGTCLEHFGLTTEKKVGSTTNMLDIVMATQFADKVIAIS